MQQVIFRGKGRADIPSYSVVKETFNYGMKFSRESKWFPLYRVYRHVQPWNHQIAISACANDNLNRIIII